MVDIIDATLPITEFMVVYPGDPHPVFMKASDGLFNTSRVMLSSHCGTHIDAPAHLVGNETTIDQIPLKRLMCVVYVISIRSQMHMTIPFLKRFGIKRKAGVLIKTGEGKYLAEGRMRESHVYPTADVATWLVKDREIKVIGIDSLSVDPPGSSTIHSIFLNAGVPIIEGLYLENVPDGRYQMFALPLKLCGLEAAPARVVLVSRPEKTGAPVVAPGESLKVGGP